MLSYGLLSDIMGLSFKGNCFKKCFLYSLFLDISNLLIAEKDKKHFFTRLVTETF